jgi:hypothetical protein
MQSISVYLYPNRITAYTNSLADWKTERYRRVYNRNIKVYRGVNNRIDLQVKNSDQKPKSVTASAIVFTLIERDQQKKVLEKDCGTVSKLNGRFFVELSETDLDDIEPGFYQFTLREEFRNTINDLEYAVTDTRLLYTDSQYNVLSTIEVLSSIQGEPRDSIEISAFNRIIDFQLSKTRFTSALIDANPRTSAPQKTHTIQVYPTNYSGVVTIEGSLDEGASPKNWADIESRIVHDEDQCFYFNIKGKYNWLRLRHDAETGDVDGNFVVTQGTYSLEYDVQIANPGIGYSIGDVITILGRNLGGETPTHDLTITVTAVNPQGGITAISWTGNSQNGVRVFVVNARDPDLVGSIDKLLYR